MISTRFLNAVSASYSLSETIYAPSQAFFNGLMMRPLHRCLGPNIRSAYFVSDCSNKPERMNLEK